MKLLTNTPSKIYLGSHSIQNFLNNLLQESNDSKVFLFISNSLPHKRVHKLLTVLPRNCFIKIVPNTESFKNFSVVQSLLKHLLTHQADRKSLLIAVGGGALLDTVGFVASIYLRGVRWWAIPTTPIAQMDSSIGGKTAINFLGKNTVGSFHLPQKTLIDIEFLSYFPKPLLEESFAEIAKMALGFDKKLCDYLLIHSLSSQESLLYALRKCILLKRKIVLADFKETKNIRTLLNFGHTFGHVFESVEKISHGKAVSKGLCISLSLSRRHGYCHKHEKEEAMALLHKMNLVFPINLPSTTILRKYLMKDKKRQNDRIHFVYYKKKKSLLTQATFVKSLIYDAQREF
ncbi:MAG: 3-dehydroquinate synthase [Deltaproteobacteria bacterium]|nr:3-dehydroquinate synthase [Deltaproteobacteria bacterium]